jgi:hypothetical protein
MGSILEMMIVLLGAAVLTIQGIKQDVANQRIATLQSEGQNEAAINAGLADYLTNQLGTLLPPGFSQTTSTALPAPTIATLTSQSNTKVNYKTGPFWGGTYQIALSVVPANCSVAAGTCHIASTLFPSKPLLKGGVADVAGAGVIASAGGNQLGYSTNKVPGTISGLNGQWSTTNPLGNVPATVMAINGFGNDANSPYYRRDGALPLTGAMNANGENISNAGAVTAKSLALPVGNSLNIGGGAIYYGDGTNAAVRTNGALFVQNEAGTAMAGINTGPVNATTATLSTNGGALAIGTGGVNYYGDSAGSAAIRSSNGLFIQNGAGTLPAPIQQVGNINSSGTVTAPTMNFNTTAATCAWNTLTMRGANQAWICNKAGNWVPLSNLVGNFTTDAQLQGYSNGFQVAVPACGSGGTPWWKVIPSSVSTNYATANPPVAGVRYGMGSNGVNWVVEIFDILADGNNTPIQDVLGLQAEVDTGCSFGND